MIPCTDAIVIWAGTTENSAKFRVTTPIKEVLQKLKQRWGNGMRIDSEGFEVTPSSPHLQPGRYEYTRIPPGTLRGTGRLFIGCKVCCSFGHDRDMCMLGCILFSFCCVFCFAAAFLLHVGSSLG